MKQSKHGSRSRLKCETCIHDSICGCMMKDCVYHKDGVDYITRASSNTIQDRFVDKNTTWWKEALHDNK